MEETKETNTKGYSKNRRTLQRKAADLMMRGLPAHEVADQLGVRFDTLLRWQKAPAFIARLDAHQAAVRKEVMLDMVRALREAGCYTAGNPQGKPVNSIKMLAEVVKLSNMLQYKNSAVPQPTAIDQNSTQNRENSTNSYQNRTETGQNDT